MDGVNPIYGAPVPSILLIDDDNRLASMVADYLRDHQFEVSHAATGAAALAAIKRQSFDLILLDLMLPDTDGLTLFRELSASRATPVIMLTARGDPMDKVVGLEIGAEDYVAKPFEPRELLARIRVVLRRGAMAPSDSLRFGRLEIDRSSRIVRIGDEEKPLTSYQFDLLNAMAERAAASCRAKCSQNSFAAARNMTPHSTARSTFISPACARSSKTTPNARAGS